MNHGSRIATATICALGASVLIAACGGGGGGNATSVGQDSPAATIYRTRCAVCHGGAGIERPVSMGARVFTDPEWQARTSVDEVVRFVEQGRGIMPRFSEILTPEEIREVSEYVLTMTE